MIFGGIDAGSRAIKVVLVDGRNGRVVGAGVADQGVKQGALASRLFRQVIREAGLKPGDISRVVATGYGRDAVEIADETITEITCHARGVREQDPKVRTVIDVGGQDSKVVRLDSGGRVVDFAVNDRCAAGTGRFLEVVAGRMGVSLDRLDALARRARRPAAISSMCVVFAETEIIGLLAAGEPAANIVAGVQSAMASRIASMIGKDIASPVVFTGGVARVPGMDRSLERALGVRVRVASNPQMTGALGAALLASLRNDTTERM